MIMDLDTTVKVQDFIRKRFPKRTAHVYLTLAQYDTGDGLEMRMKELSRLTGVKLVPLRRMIRTLRLLGLIEVTPVLWPHSDGIRWNKFEILPVEAPEDYIR